MVQVIIERSGALGYYVDDSTATVVAVVSATIQSTLEGSDLAGLGISYRIESRPITRAEIASILDELGRPESRPATKNPYGAYFDPSIGKVVIDGSDSPTVFAAIEARYPQKIAYRQGVGGGRDSRRDDIPPHWGGAWIYNPDPLTGGYCTSGFTVQTPTNNFRMVTAGHCYPLNARVTSPSRGVFFGTVSTVAPFPTRDLELICCSTYDGHIYRGDATGYGVSVLGAGDPVVGAHGYCVSGAATTEHCGQTVTSLTGQYCDPGGGNCTANVIVYSGGAQTGGGDSGAPFYLPSSNGVLIRGVHFGHINSNMYAEKWSTLHSLWGVTIVTS